MRAAEACISAVCYALDYVRFHEVVMQSYDLLAFVYRASDFEARLALTKEAR